MSNLVMRELDETAAGGPIGARLAAWRLRRGLTREDLASGTGLPFDYVAALETGDEWVDRRGRLAALAAALRLDVADLTGQPYPPRGEEHAVVRAVAFQLRRRVARLHPNSAAGLTLEELAKQTRAAAQADAVGDEHALALALPELIEAADQAVVTAPALGRTEAVRLRVQVHVLGAGLLRRLGYKDLAWMLLHDARRGTREPLPVLVEEVRLLIDLGLPEYALARAERAEDAGAGWELPVLAALAQAMAGRRRHAEQLLAEAAGRATDARESAMVVAARAAVAAEYGDAEEAAMHARASELTVLDGAQRSRLLMVAAAAEARQDSADQAAARLVEADTAAPLRLRLDPFARELVAALAARTTDTVQVAAVRKLAERAGLR
ncbi:helix-turn-helix domain-containing protein [Streptomyces kasugaensis]|nr:helix-turn-helix transcriptional regulator [Streptomyces kasugaensis]